MKDKKYQYVDWLLLLYSIIALIFTLLSFNTGKELIDIIPFIVESLLYPLIFIFIRKERKRRIIIYIIFNFLFIIIHILIALKGGAFILIRQLSFNYGFIILLSIFSMFVIYGKKNKIPISFIFLLVAVMFYSFLFHRIYEQYLSHAWKNICVKNFINSDIGLDVSENRIEEHCNCVFQKLRARYGSVANFPPLKDYSDKDNFDANNCAIDFLLPDSVNKDSIRENLNMY